ncbi:MAG: hypothetical protein KJ727_04145 [Acidobacteria bacterium]|nr:hypothetical protein [Acidobacteriota bacterium]
MKNTHLIPVIGLAALLGFSACLIYVAEPQGRDFSQPAAEYSDSISIDEGGRLSLRNEEGVVEIEGWDEREIELTAKKCSNRLPAETCVSIPELKGCFQVSASTARDQGWTSKPFLLQVGSVRHGWIMC